MRLCWLTSCVAPVVWRVCPVRTVLRLLATRRYTTSVPNIIFNVVSLDYILRIDELVFEVFTPRGLWAKMQSLQPPTFPVLLIGGVDLRSVLTTVATLTVWLCFFSLAVVPQRDNMVSARDALCAGDRDFVFNIDGAGIVFWAHHTSADTSTLNSRNFPDGSAPTKTFALATTATWGGVIQQIPAVTDMLLRQQGRAGIAANCDAPLDPSSPPPHYELGTGCFIYREEIRAWLVRPGRPDCCTAFTRLKTSVSGGVLSLADADDQTPRSAVQEWNPGCIDTLSQPGSWVPLLGVALGSAVAFANNSACPTSGCPLEAPMCEDGNCIFPKCSDMLSYCRDNSVAGLRARQLCPQTCRCDDPRAPLTLFNPEYGCVCAATSPRHRHSLPPRHIRGI